jgi:hypothetical protein
VIIKIVGKEVAMQKAIAPGACDGARNNAPPQTTKDRIPKSAFMLY